MKKISLVLFVAVVIGGGLLALFENAYAKISEEPHAVFGGGFDTLEIVAANALGNEVINYYLDGQPNTLSVDWVQVASNNYATTITGTARWESVKVDDVLSVASDSSHWMVVDSLGWAERVPMTPQLEVGGELENTVILTSTFGYGTEDVFVGGLVSGEVISQTLGWQQVADGVHRASVDADGWQAFKVGFDRLQEVQVSNPHWTPAVDGWVKRADVVQPEAKVMYLPTIMKLVAPPLVPAPDGFCDGTFGWGIPAGANLQNPQCGDGSYIVHLLGDEHEFGSFDEAVDYIGGREATVWFRPADW